MSFGSIFKNIGHAVASFGLAIWHGMEQQAGVPAGAGIAVTVADVAAHLLEQTGVVHNGAGIVNAGMTVLGDVVQEVKAIGAARKAGDPITLTLSEAAVATVEQVLPDFEKFLASLRGTQALPAPAAPVVPGAQQAPGAVTTGNIAPASPFAAAAPVA